MSNNIQRPSSSSTTPQAQKISRAELKRKKKNKKINNGLIVTLLCCCLIVIGVFIFNIVVTASKVSTATGTTLTVDTNSSMKNDLYRIGNNPTELQRQYFQELTSALKDNNPETISEFIVKSFVTDYFTWTNKDGNYEVGGLQYIYGPMFTSFQEESRYTFYADLDLYISQFGRENLLEVTDVQTLNYAYAGNYEVGGNKYEAYYIEATWTYKDSSKIDVSSFENTGCFTLINRDGRYEIVTIFNNFDEMAAVTGGAQ